MRKRSARLFGVGIVVLTLAVPAAAESVGEGLWGRFAGWLQWLVTEPTLEVAPLPNGPTVDPDGRVLQPNSGQAGCENGAQVDPDGRCPTN